MAKFGILVAASLLLQPTLAFGAPNLANSTDELAAEVYVVPTVIALTPGVGWVTSPPASRLDELVHEDKALGVLLSNIEASGISAALEPTMISTITTSGSEEAKAWAARALEVAAFSLGRSDADARYWTTDEIVPKSMLWEPIAGISNEILWPGKGNLLPSFFDAFPNKQVIVPISQFLPNVGQKTTSDIGHFQNSTVILNRDKAATLFSALVQETDDNKFAEILDDLVTEIRSQPHGVLAVDRMPLAESYRFQDAVAGLSENGIYLTKFSGLNDSATQVTPGLLREDSAIASVLGEIRSLIKSGINHANFLQNPEEFKESQYARLIAFTSAGWVEEQERFNQFVEEQKPRLSALAEGIKLEVADSINIFGSNAHIPVVIQNPFPQEVTLTVLISSKTSAVTEMAQLVTLPAQSRTTEKIAPQVHENGEAIIDITLVSESGAVVASATNIKLNVQTEWESVGVISIIAVVVLLLALGIIRSIKKRRKI